MRKGPKTRDFRTPANRVLNARSRQSCPDSLLQKSAGRRTSAARGSGPGTRRALPRGPKGARAGRRRTADTHEPLSEAEINSKSNGSKPEKLRKRRSEMPKTATDTENTVPGDRRAELEGEQIQTQSPAPPSRDARSPHRRCDSHTQGARASLPLLNATQRR